MNRYFKIWPVLRDVLILTVLTYLGGFIVGFASTDRSSRFYFYGIAISNSLFCIIGFTISGYLGAENRWRHLALVAAIAWAVSIFNVIFFGLTIIQWVASAIAIAIFAFIGGGISFLFKGKSLLKISSGAGDDKFYEEVARELQDKPMIPGLWTKAFSEMDGDDAKARALYIKYRVAQLAEACRQRCEKERQEKQAEPAKLDKQIASEPAKLNTKQVVLAVFTVISLIIMIVVLVLREIGEANSTSNTSSSSTLTAVQMQAESEFDKLKKSAEKGDAKAQAALGIYYYKGWGVKQDYEEAVKWFRMAADQGNAEAQSNLGACYASGIGVAQDSAEKVKWYRKSADQNYAGAQVNLGDCYLLGEGVPKDEVEAVKWYRKAADQGLVEAQDSLGACYLSGKGVPENEVEAVKWYRKAAEQGYYLSQSNLGASYAKGYGVESNLVQAAKWYSLAAAQDFESAKTELAITESKMTPEQIAETKKLAAAFVPKKEKSAK